MPISVVTRNLSRTWSEEGKAALSAMIRTNDMTYAIRTKDGVSRKVFKLSKQKMVEMKLDANALLVGVDEEAGKVYLMVVGNDVEGAVMKGRKTNKGTDTKKAQEFAYNELADALKLGDEKAGFDVKPSSEAAPEGVISLWEVTPAELVRNSKDDKDEDEDEAPVAASVDETEDEEEATEAWSE